ncbi:transcription antitermination factor NusB [bacterium]|nr:transcription antitermination factor NusB [bacterium]MBT5015714.1 transcription antitermination factor NusB [bacterium]
MILNTLNELRTKKRGYKKMDDNNNNNLDNSTLEVDLQLIQIKKIDGEYSRRQIRSLVFHLLYAMEEFDYDVSLDSLIDNFNRGFDQEIEIDGEIATITQKVIDDRHELDKQLQPFLEKWRLERLGVCTKIILRLGLWEMLHDNVRTIIAINEAVELAKCFTEKDAYKFINGVLDRIATHLGKKDEKEDDDKATDSEEASD